MLEPAECLGMVCRLLTGDGIPANRAKSADRRPAGPRGNPHHHRVARVVDTSDY